MSHCYTEPSTSLGWHGDDKFAVRIYIPLTNCVIQFQRPSFLAAVEVVPVEYCGYYDADLTARKIHATSQQSESIIHEKWRRVSPDAVSRPSGERNKGPAELGIIDPSLWTILVGILEDVRVGVGDVC